MELWTNCVQITVYFNIKEIGIWQRFGKKFELSENSI